MAEETPVKYTITIDDPNVEEKTKKVIKAFDEIGEAAAKAGSKVDETAEKIKQTGIALDETAGKMESTSQRMADSMFSVNSTLEDNTQKMRENREAASQVVTANEEMAGAEEKHESIIYKLCGGQEKYKAILDAMPPGMRMFITEMTGMVNASKAFIATPLGAILAALILAFEAISTWLHNDSEALEDFAAITGRVSGLLSGLKQVAMDIGKALFYAFSEPKKALESLKQALLGFSDIKNIIPATSDLSVQEAKLRKDRNKWKVDEAKYDSQIAELRVKMSDASQKAADRAKAAADAEELIKKKYETRVELAEREYQIVKKRNSLTTSSQEDLEHEADLEAAVERERAAMNRELNMFVRRNSSLEQQMQKANETMAKGENALAMKMLNSANKRASQVRELEMMVAQARIDAMDDGAEKTIRQMELDERQMLNKAEQMKQSYLQQKIQDAKAEFDADTRNKGRVFDPESIKLTEEEVAMFDEYLQKIREKSAKQQADLFEMEVKDMNDYLAKFGDYQEQRLAITNRYAEQRAKAENEWQRKTADSEEADALRALDDKFGKTTRAMADLFADSSQKSVMAIQEIISKYEQLITMMESGNIDRDKLKGLGFSDDDIAKIQKGEIKLKDLSDQLKELKGELADRSPWQSFMRNVNEGIKKLGSGEKGGLGQGVYQITKSIQDFMPALKEFGSEIANIFGADDSAISGITDGLGGLMTAGQGVGQIMSGDIVGGAMAAVQGISQVVSALDGLFGADYSQYNKMKEQYDLLSGVWDDLIAKKKEYIAESYGMEAAAVEKEAEDILKKKLADNYELIKTLAGSGASIGSHSLGYRINKNMSDADWRNLSSVAGARINQFGDILSLKPEQIAKALESDKFVSVLNSVNSDFLTYLQNIADYREELEELQDSLNEQLTNTSFDSVYDGFVSTLMDLRKPAEDFADDISEKFASAILSQQMGKQYKDKLNEWYRNFAKDMNDGQLTEAEMTALRQEYMNMVNAALEERDRIAEITGYKASQMDEYTQSASKGGYSSMNQETGDELLGRETAQQIALEDIQEKTAGIAMNLEQMRGLAVMQVEHLANIEKNTNELYQINERLGRIEDNTSRL
ncbi:MAG: hypothetical protein MJZ26_09140 [Fibrobacter sp.]|nr:hypothetical protein [Fibrobacter sp.]